MTKLWTKIKSCFKSKPVKKKPTLPAKSTPIKSEVNPPPVKPFNAKHYRKLISQLAQRAVTEQRQRSRERRRF